MGPKTTPSLISKGGYQIPPPPGGEGNRHPLGNRVNDKVGNVTYVGLISSINLLYAV